MHETDDNLLLRWRAGDAAAYEVLFTRCYPLVFRAARTLLGDAEADDLAQEALLALYRQPPAAGASVVAWLCRVALNRGRNLLRGERRAAARAALLLPANPADPQDLAVMADERAGVRRALARLPERQAQVLALRHAGLSYAQVAAALDLAPGSIGTLLARAERAFAEIYAHTEITALTPRGDDDRTVLR